MQGFDAAEYRTRTLRTSPSYTRSRRSSSSLAAARESSSHGTPKIVARKAYGRGGQGIVSERLTHDTLRFRGVTMSSLCSARVERKR